MPRVTAQMKPNPEPNVEEIANLVRRLNRREQAKLLRLVPELRMVQPDEALPEPIEPQSEGVLAYFREKMAAFPDSRPMQDDELFIAGLTVGEFFALPDEEQARLWDEAHREAEEALEHREYPVRPDALPAR